MLNFKGYGILLLVTISPSFCMVWAYKNMIFLYYPCIGIRLSATTKSQPVAVLTWSREKSGLSSVNIRPFDSSTSKTPWNR